jgi:hypothetical protein
MASRRWIVLLYAALAGCDFGHLPGVGPATARRVLWDSAEEHCDVFTFNSAAQQVTPILLTLREWSGKAGNYTKAACEADELVVLRSMAAFTHAPAWSDRAGRVILWSGDRSERLRCLPPT